MAKPTRNAAPPAKPAKRAPGPPKRGRIALTEVVDRTLQQKPIARPRPAAKKIGAASPGPAPQLNWAAVKRRYQHDNRKTVAALAAHYGIDAKRLRDMARERGWLRPSSRRGRDKRKLERPSTLKERLLAVLDDSVTQMEITLQDDHLPLPSERERQSSDLARFIRSLGQIKPDAPAREGAKVAANTAGAADDDQDRWRRELVERIRALKERLQSR